MDENILQVLIDFAGENWHAFLLRCKESGLTVEEVEKAIKKFESEK